MLLRGGRRDVGGPGAPAVAETVGEGVDDILSDSFPDQGIHSDLFTRLLKENFLEM